MGNRNSYRLTKHARRGVARSGGGHPNLGSNAGRPGSPGGAKAPQVAPVPRVVERRGNWFSNGGWYPLIVLLTLGMGSAFAFVPAGRRLERQGVQAMGTVYSVAAFVGFVLSGVEINPVFDVIAPVLLLGSTGVATIHLLVLAGQLNAAPPVRRTAVRRGPERTKPHQAGSEKPKPEKPKSAPVRRVDPALAMALDARAKRAQARELIAKDPLLADELHIGRPDLGRTFDDGGLVDINHATAEAMAAAFNLKPAHAKRIVEVRAERDGFANVDEMLVLVDLPVSAWDRIRDRSITLSA